MTRTTRALGATLDQCLAALFDDAELPLGAGTGEGDGDAHLVASRWKEALAAYEGCTDSTRLRAKRGWCLVQLRRAAEAQRLLTSRNCGTHSAAHAACAVAMTGRGWIDWDELSGSEATRLRQRVADQLGKALAAPTPPTFTFDTYRWLARGLCSPDDQEATARRAIEIYATPHYWMWLAEVHLAHNRTNAQTLRELRDVLDSEGSFFAIGEVAEATLSYAIAHHAFGEARDVIDWILARAPEEEHGVEILRLNVDAHRLRAGEDVDRAALWRRARALVTELRELPTQARHEPTLQAALSGQMMMAQSFAG